MSLYVKSSYGNGKSSNRRNLDIVRDMLSVASVKARKTRIMYQANLSYVQIEKYLGGLLENGLLDHDGEFYYSTTKKGLEFLRLYDYLVEQEKLIREKEAQSKQDRLHLEKMCSSCQSSGKKNAKKKAIQSA